MVFRLAFVEGATPDKWARAWRERMPEALELILVEEAEQLAGVRAGEHDAALVRLPVDRDGLHLVRLYDEQPVVVAGRDHLVAAAEEVELDDLSEEQLVRPHASGWRPAVEQFAFPPLTVGEAVETVAAGTGIVLLPMSVARLHARRDVVVRPVRDLPVTTVGLAWLVSADGPRAQAMVGVVRGRRPGSTRG